MTDSPLAPPITGGLRSVCLFCGSSNAAPGTYLDLAERFGSAVAQRGLRLVYGGGGVGLMGRAAKAALDAGGEVLGVMPRFLARREVVFDDAPHLMVDTMHERKHAMFNAADGFAVLPGGIGTLEEVVEILSWRRLELHKKPVVFLSEDDFWAPFFELIEHTVSARLTPPAFAEALLHSNSVADCLDALESHSAGSPG